MYIRNLLYRARAHRSVAWLTAAFLAQNPTWNNQAAAVALSIYPVLNLAHWDYDLIEPVFFSDILPLIPEGVRPAKMLALQAFVTAKDFPREIDFGPSLAGRLAQAAILHRELPNVVLKDGKLRLPGYWAFVDLDEVPNLTHEEYLIGVPVEVRAYHPDFLYSKASVLAQRFVPDYNPWPVFTFPTERYATA
jgi:hypothetical protein